MTRRAERLARHGAAFAVYALLAFAFIDHGRPLLRDLVGQGSDPFGFVWFLAWWPFAISHHLDPLHARLIWQPAGVAIDWVTSVPLLALAGWPLTRISPVLSFNVFVLLGPVLAAFTAYLLCLRIARQTAAAIIGGFLFGFSSYEMGQDTATLNLSFTMFVPALLLVVLLRLDDALNRRQVVALAACMLICQFLICIEIFALIFVFGGMAWLLAMLYLPERRAVLRRLVADALLVAPFVLLVLSPLLISMSKDYDTINLPAIWPYYYTTDLLNFLVPARGNLFGNGLTRLISEHFNGGLQEQDGYIGLPLLLLLGLFARESGARPVPRLLLALLLLFAVFSLGPRLWIGGHFTNIPMPWTLFVHLPLIHSALPVRFALFGSLCAAMIAALWIAAPGGAQKNLRLALGILTCLALLPFPYPWIHAPDSAFFRPGRVAALLGPAARVLVLPFSIQGASSFWQAESRFDFVQTGGYLGFPPKPMQAYPAVYQLFGGTETPELAADIASFCAATRTQFVVIGPGTPSGLRARIASLGWPGRKLDDVLVYAVPGGSRAGRAAGG